MCVFGFVKGVKKNQAPGDKSLAFLNPIARLMIFSINEDLEYFNADRKSDTRQIVINITR